MIKSIRNRSNYFQFPQDFEKVSQLPSMTIQGESYSIRDLVLQMSQGVIPQKSSPSFPSTEPTHEDLDLEQLNRSSPMTKKLIQAEITADITTDYSIYQQHTETLKKLSKNDSKSNSNQTNQQQTTQSTQSTSQQQQNTTPPE